MYSYIKLLFAALLFFTACKTQEVVQITKSTDAIYEDVAYLASDELEGRRTGTKGEELAAKYIAERFEALGLMSKGTDGYFQEFSTRKKSNPHAVQASETDALIVGRNVVAGIDHGAQHTVVIGAHFDHLGHGGEGSLAPNSSEIHNGADDNASGVAAMLELAEKLKKGPKNNNYIFLAFSGEEEGLWGSNHFTKNPTVNLKEVNYMINMDMVGRLNDERQLAIYGVGTSPIWKDNIAQIKTPSFKFKFEESGVGPSDHTSFYLKDIPVLHFFTGQHRDYHKPSDDVELVNFNGIRDIVDFIYALVSRLDDDGELAFTKTKDEQRKSMNFKVTLGVVPDYLYDGKGMRIDGTSDDRPAQKAGLESGDIVLKMGDIEINDMMGYMKALGKFEKGQTVIVVVKRGEELVEKEVTF